MQIMSIVTEAQARTARNMEAKLLALSPESGILFVGVSVLSRVNADPIYRVWLGCDRKMDERMYAQLVRVTLQDEIGAGILVETEAHRGVDRKSFLTAP